MSKGILQASLDALVKSADGQAKLLYTLYYEQKEASASPLDLSFDDRILDHVESDWRQVMAEQGGALSFMQFEERKGMDADEEDENDY
jgi:hypothetical protein